MTMMIRMAVVSILSSFDLHGDDRRQGITMWQAYFVSYRVLNMSRMRKYATIELLMSENLAYIKNKKRGSRERSSPPCQIKTLILPRCPKARGNIDLDLTLTRKFCRTLAPRGATLTDHVCAPSNGFRAAVL
jgi:hypothetical protein